MIHTTRMTSARGAAARRPAAARTQHATRSGSSSSSHHRAVAPAARARVVARSGRHAALEAALAAPDAQGIRMPPARPAFPTVVSAAGRSADDVAADVAAQLAHWPCALVSDVAPETYAALRPRVLAIAGDAEEGGAKLQYQARARMLSVRAGEGHPAPKQARLPGTVLLLSGGPEDAAAADAAKMAAEHMGCYVVAKSGLGVRAIATLLDQLPALRAADAVIAVAGGDPALPGAVAGLVDAPVIALPTSAGAGNALQGVGSLVAAAGAGCPGVAVVGIDAAAAAAAMAARVLRTTAVRVERMMAAQQQQQQPQPHPKVPAFVLPANAANNVVPSMFDSFASLAASSAALEQPAGVH